MNDTNIVIDNYDVMSNLMVLMSGDVETNSKLKQKYGARVHNICDLVLDLCNDLKSEKSDDENHAIPELVEFCNEEIFSLRDKIIWKEMGLPI